MQGHSWNNHLHICRDQYISEKHFGICIDHDNPLCNRNTTVQYTLQKLEPRSTIMVSRWYLCQNAPCSIPMRMDQDILVELLTPSPKYAHLGILLFVRAE
ncbi:hypothetical protein E2C01_070705 [Portunus trituberculatus]|uniref:Uncharacterized protein n=1 Tax=Portunus trituberculatus TaxID=210409 RepID=A0A5B7I2U6_PORTR|nr:hypothetical protein [Portunus trituberculatus]